jgi:xylose dehydrogenase (NAD/NADP)
MLEFADGLLAQITCSYDSALHRQAFLVGSVGTIQTTFSNHTTAAAPGSLTLSRLADGKYVDTLVPTAQANGFLAEAESFVALIQQGPEYWNGASAQESVDIALTLEAILSSARERRPVDIP